jgi:hypothetical protein
VRITTRNHKWYSLFIINAMLESDPSRHSSWQRVWPGPLTRNALGTCDLGLGVPRFTLNRQFVIRGFFGAGNVHWPVRTN